MNPVLTDSPTHHHGDVAGINMVYPGTFAVHFRRKNAPGPAKHKRLSEVALVKEKCPGYHGNPALVPPVNDAPVNTVEDGARRKETGGHRRGVRTRRTEAEHIRIEDRPGTFPGSENVTIDTDNSGYRTAIRIERRRAVVRLRLEAKQRFIVKPNDPGIVMKHTLQKTVVARHRFCGCPDIGAEEVVNRLLRRRVGRSPGRRVRPVCVVDPRREDLVLAVLAPCLRNHLQLDVGRLGRQPRAAPRGRDLRSRVVGANGVELVS